MVEGRQGRDAAVPPCNLFLVTGDDEAMIVVESAKIVRQVAGEAPDAFALETVREREGVPVVTVINELLRALKSPPFIGGRKTLWLKNFSLFAAESTAKSRGADAKALAELAAEVAKGIAPDIVLVMNGPGADLDKPLAKACSERGSIIVCSRPNRRDRQWRAQMRTLVAQRARDQRADIAPDAVDVLVDAIGTDTSRIDCELEKLICYVGGPGNRIGRQDAELLCVGEGEELPWALGDALGKRDPQEVMRVIAVLLQPGAEANPGVLTLLRQMARYYSELLQMKLFMLERQVRGPAAVGAALKQLTREDKERCAAAGLAVTSIHPYRGQSLAEQSAAYEGRELVEALRVLRDACLTCMSSSLPERQVLDLVVLRLVARLAPPASRRASR